MKIGLLFMMLVLSGCVCDEACRNNFVANDDINCKPELIAKSPDGVNLWRINNRCSKIGYGDVYFSSRGTSHIERAGKSSRLVTTPNEDE